MATGKKDFARFVGRITGARTLNELLKWVRIETREAAGYDNVWLMVGEEERPKTLSLVSVSSGESDNIEREASQLTVTGDPFLEELIASYAPVVIVDARTDPRTDKRMVAALKNRTLINFPLRLVGKPFGLFGVGTFGDEGCKAPTDSELHYLTLMSYEIAIACSRILVAQQATHFKNQDMNLLVENARQIFASRESNASLLVEVVRADLKELKHEVETKYVTKIAFAPLFWTVTLAVALSLAVVYLQVYLLVLRN